MVLSVFSILEESRTSGGYWDLAQPAPILLRELLNILRSLAESTLPAIAGAAVYPWVDNIFIKIIKYRHLIQMNFGVGV